MVWCDSTTYSTVRVALINNTPLSAHFIRHPESGTLVKLFIWLSFTSSLYMFFNEGGKDMPSGTENDIPIAWQNKPKNTNIKNSTNENTMYVRCHDKSCQLISKPKSLPSVIFFLKISCNITYMSNWWFLRSQLMSYVIKEFHLNCIRR